MKPHVIMHMVTSIDGRIVTTHWPKDFAIGALYEDIHQQLKGDAWLVGPVSMAEFAVGEAKPVVSNETFARETWKAPHAHSGPYAIALDRHGKLHLNIDRANGDPLVLVVPESVSDNYLAELRRDGISYLFAGASELHLPTAMNKLAQEFGIGRLLLEGGGGMNGAFLDAGLIDEITLLMMPFADGTRGAPALFERNEGTPVVLNLESVVQLERGVLHLRYKVT
ncbi:pyrimidine reductase [Duganella sp. FT135W]|uniref:Pyrimidine reductase n=1 Tax=Duganella flavida TaxID=2692175 RepID=A0A6L8K410_9BURK|nr:dihydrofolate reductase family protein [Duganella flavida]MYM22196.1 pyrimidine reductase [Duganella flavida]